MTSSDRPRKRRPREGDTLNLPLPPGSSLAQPLKDRIAQTISDAVAARAAIPIGKVRWDRFSPEEDPFSISLLEESQALDSIGQRPPDPARRAHNRRQARLFNKLAPEFEKPLPQEIQQRLEQIVAAAGIRSGETVLDVGTGTGVLLPLILARQPSRVMACDLSREMLARARARFKGQVRFFQKDVVDLVSAIDLVDVVFCNACFDNFHDQQEALKAINALCYYGGRLVISHPMGRGFVHRLKEENPEMVAWDLPGRAQLEAMLEETGFRLELFRDEPELYLAVAKKLADAIPPNPEFYMDLSPY